MVLMVKVMVVMVDVENAMVVLMVMINSMIVYDVSKADHTTRPTRDSHHDPSSRARRATRLQSEIVGRDDGAGE